MAESKKKDEKKKKFPQSKKAMEHLASSGPHFKFLIEKVGSPKLFYSHERGVFEAFASSITYQQLHGKAAATILQRFVTLHSKDGSFPHPELVLKSSLEQLMTCGLSRAKATAILDLAQKVSEGIVPEREQTESMSNEELIAAFTQVRGIGRWTVEMFLIFTLGRTDVFPSLDFAVRKGYVKTFKKRKDPSPKELDKISAKWAPYRSIAAWYFWRAMDGK